MPAVPLIPTVVNVATPPTAATVAVPTTVAGEFTVMVTDAVLVVTVLPPASWTVTTGCVVNAAPLGAPAAGVVSASLAAEGLTTSVCYRRQFVAAAR